MIKAACFSLEMHLSLYYSNNNYYYGKGCMALHEILLCAGNCLQNILGTMQAAI